METYACRKVSTACVIYRAYARQAKELALEVGSTAAESGRNSHNRIKCLEILKSLLNISDYKDFTSRKRYRRIP